MQCKYKRVLIKLSGEALGGSDKSLDYEKVDEVANALLQIHQMGVQIGVVVGGGNIFRGRSCGDMNRTDADHMGMLATVINGLALKDALVRSGVDACVMSAIEMYQVCEQFSQREAVRKISQNEIVIFVCGTGRPYFSTDTGASLRALEIDADVMLCGKYCDGVYDKDPGIYKDAVRYDTLTYDKVINDNLNALDQSAIIMCRDCKKDGMPIFVFGLNEPNSLINAVNGTAKGTFISC